MLVKSQVKYIQSLGHKKFRDADGVFVAEGPKIINELLQSRSIELVTLFVVKDWIDENDLLAGSVPGDKLVVLKNSAELDRISFLSAPNQALAVFKKPAAAITITDTGIYLALDGIQDPGNLGTIIRIADWFGVSHIICSETSADAYNPKTIQATMGSISRVRLSYENLVSVIARYPGAVYAATLDGKNVFEMDRIEAGMIVIGNESAGVSEEILGLVRNRVTIPRRGEAESLNAAVAAGILLSHLC